MTAPSAGRAGRGVDVSPWRPRHALERVDVTTRPLSGARCHIDHRGGRAGNKRFPPKPGVKGIGSMDSLAGTSKEEPFSLDVPAFRTPAARGDAWLARSSASPATWRRRAGATGYVRRCCHLRPTAVPSSAPGE